MRIVIDMQGAQSTGSRNRGIGRYTLDLVEAMIREGREHEFILALNGLFADTLEPLRQRFGPQVGLDNIRVWTAPAPVRDIDPHLTDNRRVAEVIRETFMMSLSPDIVMVTSLFEGLDDDAVTSVASVGSSIPTAVIFYDLIPLICRQHYLSYGPVEAWYERKLQHLRRADLLLAISQASKVEGEHYLAFPTDNIVNISSAASRDIFRKLAPGETDFSAVAARYGVTRPFVMYTGGIDLRKNIDSLVLAFAGMDRALREAHQLVIVCSATPESIANLRALAARHMNPEDLVITGFVPEEDLIAFYNNCKLFAFPSWMEGFGLPILEAMQCGAPVIGSDRSAVPEVIGLDECLFDPHSVPSITARMAEVLGNEELRERLRQHSAVQAAKFSWDLSAVTALDAMEQVVEKRRSAAQGTQGRKPRMAFVSPLPPEHSGIADYSAHILPDLARHYDIDLIVAQEKVSTPSLNANFAIRDLDWFRRYAGRYERIVYQFGNSTYHSHMFGLLERYPGAVVLHDFFLSGIGHYREASGETDGGFWCDLYRDHGYEAIFARASDTDVVPTINAWPANGSVLNGARGVIVHSRHARELAEKYYGSGPGSLWATVASVRAPALEADKAAARKKLGIAPDAFLVCSFGHLADTKLNVETIRAFEASVAGQSATGVLVLAGAAAGTYEADVAQAIRKSPAARRISVTGRIPDETYQDYLAAADLAIQLRTNSRGETSAAVLDTMNAGLPTIASRTGSMAELPEDCVAFMPDDFSVDALTGHINRFAQDREAGAALGARARAFISCHHMPRVVADAYAQAIERFYLSPWPSAAVVVENARRKGVNFTDTLAEATATAIARTFPPVVGRRQILVDVSGLISDMDTGGTAASLLYDLLCKPCGGYRIEPVFRDEEDRLRYARSFTVALGSNARLPLADDTVDFHYGDILLSSLDPERASGADHAAMVVSGVTFATEWPDFGPFMAALADRQAI